MVGTVAQYVALTCHGNAFLKGHNVDSLIEKNSTCQFCETVNFTVSKKNFLGRKRNVTVAETPNDWFGHLKSINAQGIRLSNYPKNDPNISERNSAGFIGGGYLWLMEVVFPQKQSEYWLAQWMPGNENAPERRIWRVTYIRVEEGIPPAHKAADLATLTKKLTDCLHDIHKFACKQDIKEFTQWFKEALDTLDSKGKNFYGYHKDLAPEGILPDQAATILKACQRAWVFGGMGSWNDMGFEGEIQIQYDRVSQQLFEIINEAIAAGATASFYGTSKQE